MFDLLPIVITLVGLAGFVLIISRRLEILRQARQQASVQEWTVELEERWGKFTPYLIKISRFIELKSRSFYGKILRSVKILNLKIDTFLTRQIEKARTQKVVVREERDILKDLVDLHTSSQVEENAAGENSDNGEDVDLVEVEELSDGGGGIGVKEEEEQEE